MRLVNVLMLILLTPMLPMLWLWCRVTAGRCPNCDSKWQTSLIGEWDGEDWNCRACGQFWTVREGVRDGI